MIISASIYLTFPIAITLIARIRKMNILNNKNQRRAICEPGGPGFKYFLKGKHQLKRFTLTALLPGGRGTFCFIVFHRTRRRAQATLQPFSQ